MNISRSSQPALLQTRATGGTDKLRRRQMDLVFVDKTLNRVSRQEANDLVKRSNLWAPVLSVILL